ncbi:hypothetical protein ACFE04_017061 [Oxalis oulophora]
MISLAVNKRWLCLQQMKSHRRIPGWAEKRRDRLGREEVVAAGQRRGRGGWAEAGVGEIWILKNPRGAESLPHEWWYARRFLHPDIVSQYEYIFTWDEDLEVEHSNVEHNVSVRGGPTLNSEESIDSTGF